MTLLFTYESLRFPDDINFFDRKKKKMLPNKLLKKLPKKRFDSASSGMECEQVECIKEELTPAEGFQEERPFLFEVIFLFNRLNSW